MLVRTSTRVALRDACTRLAELMLKINNIADGDVAVALASREALAIFTAGRDDELEPLDLDDDTLACGCTGPYGCICYTR